jgi:hypothetical protein
VERDEEERCGTCRYHAESKIEGYVCVCIRSPLCGEWTNERDNCKEWREKK